MRLALYLKPLHRLRVLGSILIACLGLVTWLSAPPVLADTLHITATVPAPLPTEPAIITSHYDQQRIESSNQTVAGTCSSDTAYVDLYRNDIFAGTSLCVAGSFSMPITFLLGPNTLQARAMSSTHGAGPTVPPITVYYALPVAPPAPLTPPKSNLLFPPITRTPKLPMPTDLPNFFITANDKTYQEKQPGELIQWGLTAQGGVRPYTITVQWGDGHQETKSFYQTNLLLGHRYGQPSFYLITVEITDTIGNKATIQLLAIVKGASVTYITDTSSAWLSLLSMLFMVLWLLLFALLATQIQHFWKQQKHKRSGIIQKDIK